MSRGMEHPGAPQVPERRADEPPPGARAGALEQIPASKEKSWLVIVCSSPMRGSSIGPSGGITKLELHGQDDISRLSDAEFEEHATIVGRAQADLAAQYALIVRERERRSADRRRKLQEERARMIAEKERIERELAELDAEIDAAVAAVDPPKTA